MLSSAKDFTKSFTNHILRTVCSADDPRFLEPAQDEIKGLLNRGSYMIVLKKDIPSEAVVFEIRHSLRNQERRIRKY